LALAARVAKYGVTLDEALWHMPLAVLNQLVVYDEWACGRRPRWKTSGVQGAAEIEAILAEAMTSGG
jgi:hypothetical protein